jgi:serine/threonine-protein kinase
MSLGADHAFRSAGFPPDAVRACLERVAVSPHFVRSRRLTDFLRFTVEARLGGRADELKERTIAVEVYGRRLDYDPRCDPIVRSEAHRLRAKLGAYYAREGCSDPIVIEYPRGSYLPLLRPNATGAEARHASLCRLAVAPFEDASPSGGDPAFAEGMGDALSARLVGRPGLRITHRISGRRRSRGREALDVDFVVEGAFRRTGERCLLSVRVVRVADGEALWSDEFPFEWARVIEVQDEITERVAAAVGAFLARAGGPRPSVGPGAYELFLKAHHGVLQYANTRQREYLEPARRRLLRAVELEPAFTDALADLAFLELLQLNPPQAVPSVLIERARGFLDRALASDPRHVRSLYLLGHVHGTSGRNRQGLDLSETAAALDPDDADARTFLALRYASLGFYESAVAACDEALRLDPAWEAPYQAKAIYATHFGAVEVAADALEELQRRTVPSAQSETSLAEVLLARGDLGGAERALASAKTRLSPQEDGSFVEVLSGLVAALRGDTASARGVFEAWRESPPRILDHLIRLCLVLGESEAALGQLACSPYHRNYRWLVGEPAARPFLRRHDYRKLLGELHEEWLSNLEELGPRLPVAPAPLREPAAILDR